MQIATLTNSHKMKCPYHVYVDDLHLSEERLAKRENDSARVGSGLYVQSLSKAQMAATL